MGQWGKSKVVEGVKFIPHVSTKMWRGIEFFGRVSKIDIVDNPSSKSLKAIDRITEELNKKYLHRPYEEWVK